MGRISGIKPGPKHRKKFTDAEKKDIVVKIKSAVKAGKTLTRSCLDSGITTQQYKVWNIKFGSAATTAVAGAVTIKQAVVTQDQLFENIVNASVASEKKKALLTVLLS